MNKTIKSSELICRALGYEPSGVPAEQPGVCALCGAEILKGDMSAPLRLGPSFVDDLYMAARGSGVICGWCTPHLTKKGIMDTGYGVFSLDGFRAFRKWEEIAKNLLEPPEPPFVIVQATANNQHMAWRSPVNWSRDIYYVRLGLRNAKIRRAYLYEAIDACVRLAKAIEIPNNQKKKIVRKMLPHPFLGLSRNLKEATDRHGQFKPAVYEAVDKNPALRKDYEHLMGLTIGESWGLLFALQSPVKP